MWGEYLLAGSLSDAVRQRELEFRSEQLLDVRALDVVGFLNLHHFQNLQLYKPTTSRLSS